MSMWCTIEDDSITVNVKDEEVELYVHQDRWGSNYLVLTFEQVRYIYNSIEGEK